MVPGIGKFTHMVTLTKLTIRNQIIIMFAQCVPLAALWNPALGHCIDKRNHFLGNAIPNIITDLLLTIMPVPYIWNLNKSNWKKAAICLAFALGGL